MNPSTRLEFSLPRSLSSLETCGFGFSGLLLWLGTAPAMHTALGPNALLVWIPGAVIGIMLNLQVQRLGTYFPNVSGGTPNYTTHLLRRFPVLAQYAAIGYFLGWISVPAMNAIILADLIESNLVPLGFYVPVTLLRICFLALPFIVAFSGTRTIGILHTFFVFPAIGFLMTFCLQGLTWLGTAPTSPGLLPDVWPTPNLVDWLKWFYIAVYAVYGCETASSFVADSRRPQVTLRCLAVTASLIPVVYVGGSWVVMRLATNATAADSTYLNLVAASQPFWGSMGPALVTFLITSGCLLSSATAVANCPRLLYQLAQDQYIPPVFSVISRRSVLAPGLLFTFALSLLSLMWGDVARVVMVTGTGYLTSMMAIHLGEWVSRDRSETRWQTASLGFFILESVVLVVGGIAWGWQDWLMGLAMPLIVGGLATQLPRLRLRVLQPSWWWQRDQSPRSTQTKADWVALQVTILITLICGAVSIGWLARARLERTDLTTHTALFSILLVTVAFIGVAIACWTSLPQIAAITEAREQVEQTLTDLQRTQTQLVQAEKMSSLGQLVAGVAHEINNPVNFIYGNLTHIETYSQDLLRLVALYQQAYPHPPDEILDATDEMDLEFLQEDLGKILHSMQIGSDRIRQIVLSLRNFSRMDEAEFKAVDIHEGIESTLLILQHRLKAKSDRPAIEVIRQYDKLPLVECYPGQLNQVVMNIVSNAIDALEEKGKPPYQITIRTSLIENTWVKIAIADNGPGIPPAVQSRIFDPFFTTKAIGKGTGMGMSISYQIITEKHGGKLELISSPGHGAEFIIQIPVQRLSNELAVSHRSHSAA